MTDFYSNPSAPAPRVLVPRFGPPATITTGADGIPDYIEATKGSPYQYIAPPGYRLAIYHYGVRIKHIAAADRRRGFAIGLHYKENADWTVTHLTKDEHGESQYRWYEKIPGQHGEPITFRLIYAGGIYTPPDMRGTHKSHGLYG